MMMMMMTTMVIIVKVVVAYVGRDFCISGSLGISPLGSTMSFLREVSPVHAPQLHFLIQQFPVVQVENVRKGHAKAPYADRFSVLVPICLDYSKWDIVFNCEYPWHAPDIIFPAEDEKFQAAILVDSNLLDVQTLWNILGDWNAKDETQLFQLVSELRSLYLQYQRRQIDQVEDERVKFEFGTISNFEDLEVCLSNSLNKTQEVKFAVPLLSTDVDPLAKNHRGLILLKVTFVVKKGQTWNSATPSLKLFATGFRKEIFDTDDVKLPVWPERMCIAEYIPTLQENLKVQVNEAFVSLNMRKNFINGLATVFGWPLEADTAFGRKVSILTSSGVFIFLVYFTLSIQFPKQQPYITLQSCLHFDNLGRPITRLYNDYPWSPRWDATEMVQRVYDFIAEESVNFKKHCNDMLQHIR